MMDQRFTSARLGVSHFICDQPPSIAVTAGHLVVHPVSPIHRSSLILSRAVVPMTRPRWDAVWCQIAQVMATRSLCSRDQVGAVIVDAHNRVVATGYNGPPAGFRIPIPHTEEGPWEPLTCDHWCPRGMHGPKRETTRSYVDCPALHAEANALSVCDRSMREGGTLYVTSPMCYTCAKLVTNSGLARVVMLLRNGDYKHRNPDESLALLDACGLAYETFWNE